MTRQPILRPIESYRSYSSDLSSTVEPDGEPEGTEDDGPPWEPLNVSAFPNGLELIFTALRTVWDDPELLAYQVASMALSIGILLAFLTSIGIPLEEPEQVLSITDDMEKTLDLLLVLLAVFFIASFFKAASIACATMRLEGKNPKTKDGLARAVRSSPALIAWAAVSAVIALLVIIVIAAARKRKGNPRVLGRLIELRWGPGSYLVIPVMLHERTGPLEALNRSASIVKRTWNISLAGNFGTDLVFGMLALPGLLLYPLGYSYGGELYGLTFMFEYMIGLGIIRGAVRAVLISSVYVTAKTNQIPADTDAYPLLGGAFEKVDYAEEAPRTNVDKVARAMMHMRRL